MVAEHATLMPGAYFRLVSRQLAGGASSPGATDAMAEPLAPDSAEITVDDQLRQAESLNRSQPPGWGLRLGAHFDATAHGTVGVAATTAATVEDAIDILGRYGHLRSPFFEFESRRSRRGMYLAISDSWGIPDDLRIPLMECHCVSVTRLLTRLAGRSADELTLHLNHTPPAHLALYPDYLTMPTSFNWPECRINVPDRWLKIRPPQADQRLHQASLTLLSEAETPVLTQRALVFQVQQIFRTSHRPTTISAVAQRFNITPRTLERRLRLQGTTYQDLADRHRRDQANHLLVSTSLPIAAIARRLGYSDSANFGRACRRWFGTSPSKHRALSG